MNIAYTPMPKYHIEAGRFMIHSKKRIGNAPMQRPHSHDQIELYYLIEGERVYFVDDRVITVHKGELILIPPHELHSTASSDRAEFERILIQFDVTLLPSSLQEATSCFNNRGYRFFQFTLREQGEIELLLMRMIEECQRQQPLYETYVITLFTELMVILLRATDITEPREPKHPLHHLVTEVATYIRRHYRRPLTLEDTAEHFFISPSHLSRVFHRLTGFHFREYIVHVRIREAERQLVETTHKIQEIASNVGFEYLSHFNKTFKRVTGLTPLQYRKGARGRMPRANAITNHV